MALADYHSNSFTDPAGGGDFNIYDKHATQRYAIGTRIRRIDGNEYVYAHFVGDVSHGLLVSPDTSEGGELAGVDNSVVAPASAATTTDGTLGSRYLEITNAGILQDEHAGGYLTIVSGTGDGYTYRIKGNSATGGPASGNVRIELYDPLVEALDATSDVHIHGAKYAQLTEATGAGGEDSWAVGVTVSDMDVSAAAYGWILVKGVGGALIDGTIAKGEAVTLSDGVAGGVQVAGGASTAVVDLIDERVIGQCLIPDASTGLGTFQFNFD